MSAYERYLQRNWRRTGYTGHVVHPANYAFAAGADAAPSSSSVRERFRTAGNWALEALGHLGVSMGAVIPTPSVAIEEAAPAGRPPQTWEEVTTAQDFLDAVDAARAGGPRG